MTSFDRIQQAYRTSAMVYVIRKMAMYVIIQRNLSLLEGFKVVRLFAEMVTVSICINPNQVA